MQFYYLYWYLSNPNTILSCRRDVLQWMEWDTVEDRPRELKVSIPSLAMLRHKTQYWLGRKSTCWGPSASHSWQHSTQHTVTACLLRSVEQWKPFEAVLPPCMNHLWSSANFWPGKGKVTGVISSKSLFNKGLEEDNPSYTNKKWKQWKIIQVLTGMYNDKPSLSPARDFTGLLLLWRSIILLFKTPSDFQQVATKNLLTK